MTKRSQYVLHIRAQDLTDRNYGYLNADGGGCGFPFSPGGECGEDTGNNEVQVLKSEESPGTNPKSLAFSIV